MPGCGVFFANFSILWNSTSKTVPIEYHKKIFCCIIRKGDQIQSNTNFQMPNTVQKSRSEMTFPDKPTQRQKVSDMTCCHMLPSNCSENETCYCNDGERKLWTLCCTSQHWRNPQVRRKRSKHKIVEQNILKRPKKTPVRDQKKHDLK